MVLILGYVFYLIGRKNEDIGFQDFLIDSVFHTKRSDIAPGDIRTPDGTNILIKTSPVPEVSPVIKVDPLATYVPPAIEVKPVIVESPTRDPLMDSEPAAIPSWLQVPKTDVVTIPDATPHIEDPVMSVPEETTGDAEITVTPVIATPESTIPSWLQVTDTLTPEDQSVPAEETKSEDIPPMIEPIEPIVASPEPSSDALPDWLVDSLRTTEPAPIAEIPTENIVAVSKPTKKARGKKGEVKNETPVVE